jgi:hypothetical protein
MASLLVNTRHDAAAQGDGGCELDEWCGGLLHKSGTRPDGEGDPKAGLRRAHRHCRQHDGEGRRQRCSPVELSSEVPGAVTGWCRWAGAVQGVRLRRCHRSGAGVVKTLWHGDILILLTLLFLGFSPSSLFSSAGAAASSSFGWSSSPPSIWW